jgi:hypothetical protein
MAKPASDEYEYYEVEEEVEVSDDGGDKAVLASHASKPPPAAKAMSSIRDLDTSDRNKAKLQEEDQARGADAVLNITLPNKTVYKLKACFSLQPSWFILRRHRFPSAKASNM